MDSFDAESRAIIERGQKAWGVLKHQSKRTWELYVSVGQALEAGRNQVMRRLGTSKPIGKTWTVAFGAWLSEAGFDLEPGARSRLMNCMKHLPAIEAWRNTLDPGKLVEWSHPSTVWRHYSDFIAPAAEPVDEPTEPPELGAALAEHFANDPELPEDDDGDPELSAYRKRRQRRVQITELTQTIAGQADQIHHLMDEITELRSRVVELELRTRRVVGTPFLALLASADLD